MRSALALIVAVAAVAGTASGGAFDEDPYFDYPNREKVRVVVVNRTDQPVSLYRKAWPRSDNGPDFGVSEILGGPSADYFDWAADLPAGGKIKTIRLLRVSGGYLGADWGPSSEAESQFAYALEQVWTVAQGRRRIRVALREPVAPRSPDEPLPFLYP